MPWEQGRRRPMHREHLARRIGKRTEPCAVLLSSRAPRERALLKEL